MKPFALDSVVASKKFFEAVGFVAAAEGSTVSLSAPGHPDVRMVLRPAGEGMRAQLLFVVDDASKAADALTAAGLKVERNGNRATVHDPDGTNFVFLEASGHKAK